MPVPLFGNELPLHSALFSVFAPSAASVFAADSAGLFCMCRHQDMARWELRTDEFLLKKFGEAMLKKLSE
jgi:hypothetical protein